MSRTLTLIILLSLFIHGGNASAVNVDSMLMELDCVVDARDTYYQLRQAKIDSLSRLASRDDISPSRRHGLYYSIFDEYSTYQGDSAKAYAFRLRDMTSADTPDERVRANIALLFVYTSCGLFKEAADVIENTSLDGVSDDVRGDYYFLLIRHYSDMSNFVSQWFTDEYARLSFASCDSVTALKHPDSYEYQYARAFKTLANPSLDQRIAHFSQLLKRSDISDEYRAIVSSMLADFYRERGDVDEMIYYKALSAMLDIKSAKHETTAARELALYLYQRGDIERANRLIHLALDDANYFNARHRKCDINNVLPLIEQSRYDFMTAQRDWLIIVVAIITLLAIALVVSVVYIIRQMKTLRRSRRELELHKNELEAANAEIESRNEALQLTNSRLRESNKIKEQYIGFGFELNAKYMDKIEALYRMVDTRLAAKQYDELRRSLKKRDLREDKESVLREFDEMFLKLFPSFITFYNSLFPEPVAADGDTVLTNEMRIFALIRLGITDSGHIATLLNYSVNTVNTYKTKAKNRSHILNERFEAKIMEIRSVS